MCEHAGNCIPAQAATTAYENFVEACDPGYTVVLIGSVKPATPKAAAAAEETLHNVTRAAAGCRCSCVARAAALCWTFDKTTSR